LIIVLILPSTELFSLFHHVVDVGDNACVGMVMWQIALVMATQWFV